MSDPTGGRPECDGLMLLSYSDTDVSVAAKTALATAIVACNAGGQRQRTHRVRLLRR